MAFRPLPVRPARRQTRCVTLSIRRFGGPTVAFSYGGHRFLTDPTFDPPGDYPNGDRKLVKTAGPTGTPADAGPVDVVLLSHDEHPDNLDRSGRAFALAAPLVLSTPAAAGRLGPPVRGLSPWEHVDVGVVRVTAVPAQHGPDGTEHLVGPVTGFVLTGDGLPTAYVSGDNASVDVVREIAGRFPAVDVAVLFGGAARTVLLGDADLTLGAVAMVEATRILGAREVVPVHVDGWAHFTEGPAEVRTAFAAAGLDGLLR
jgi:L-ascorbate metabolism protein UlaG (beta-lactamase superfamily)